MPIQISDFDYHLPDEKIALFPVAPRDTSNLLVYQGGEITEKKFHQIHAELPYNSLVVFNNTKVIPARLFFNKATGAAIEIFLLDPIAPSKEVVKAMEAESGAVWKCMIGNLKKWKNNEVLKLELANVEVHAELVDSENRYVKITWNNATMKMVDIIQAIGKIPIPPYLNRAAEEEDSTTYQTVYAKNDGAVAAPTAGLHFTENVFKSLDEKEINRDFVTLHVGAGTFQPVKETGDVTKHHMHAEQFVVKKSAIENILGALGNITVVGTTSMRTLESLFWLGNQLCNSNKYSGFVAQLEPYNTENITTPKAAFEAILNYMNTANKTELHGSTEIMIFPGYEFKICNNLITNFHQPKSTLMLLIAAFIGDDWKKIYNYALSNNFRFLSYGDSSILKRG